MRILYVATINRGVASHFFYVSQIVQRKSYIKFWPTSKKNNYDNSQLNFRTQNYFKVLLC